MKILEVVFSLICGGGERVVVDLCNEFAESGHNVTLLTVRDIDQSPLLSFNKQFLSDKVQFRNLKAKYPTPGAWCRISKLLKEIKPDVVHMHLNVLPYFFPEILFGDRKIKYFHTLHSVAQAACGYRGQRLINRWFYKTGRITPVTISELCNQSYQEFYHLPPAAMIENGRSCPVPTEKKAVVRGEINKMKRHPDDKVFIQVGTVAPVKNQALSIRVFQTLLEKDYHAILLLLGPEHMEHKEYCEQMRRECPSNCYFLGECSNVADYLVNSDYFLMPSIYEGLPISLLEAMACGCVPVCTAVGGIPNVVSNEQNGYLIPSPEYTTLLNCVESRLQMPEHISRESEKQYFLDHYESKNFAKKYLQLFLCGKQP